jgi:hypothetical protein
MLSAFVVPFPTGLILGFCTISYFLPKTMLFLTRKKLEIWIFFCNFAHEKEEENMWGKEKKAVREK